MKRICSYCNCDLNTDGQPANTGGDISHGICRDCLEAAMSGIGEPLKEFLDSLPAPILVVDNDVRVKSANSRAIELLSLQDIDTADPFGGEVFRCKSYDESTGCGQDLHCQSCTIRNSVEHTAQTGESCDRVPACLDLDAIAGTRQVRLFISTEKVNDVVLLRLDDFQPAS